MTKTPAPSDSRYFGAKPSQSTSPVSANTSAPSSNEVFRRNARNRAIAGHVFMESEHLQNSDVSWGHEPGLRKSLDCRQTTFRFMERENLQHWDANREESSFRLAGSRDEDSESAAFALR